jgi:hypothetical protein
MIKVRFATFCSRLPVMFRTRTQCTHVISLVSHCTKTKKKYNFFSYMEYGVITMFELRRKEFKPFKIKKVKVDTHIY